MMDKYDIENALEDCASALDASNCPFSDWEKEFIESLWDQFRRRKILSDKQIEILERIWDKV